jgi:hypothetical protein
MPESSPDPGDLRFTYAGEPHVSGPYLYVRPEDIEGVLTRYTAGGRFATLIMRSGQKIPVDDFLDDVRARLAEARRVQPERRFKALGIDPHGHYVEVDLSLPGPEAPDAPR